MSEIYVLTAPLATLGENALWDVDEERLYWIDIFGAAIFRCTDDGRDVRVSKVEGTITSLALRAGGGAIATMGSTIRLIDLDTGDTEQIFDAATGQGFNDGKVDRQGRFVTGTVDSSLMGPGGRDLIDRVTPSTKLYRVDADLTTQVLDDGVGASNGPCFSPDGSTLYWGDSWARRIYSWDYDGATGQASGRRVLTAFEDSAALPDGATVDSEGFVWVATFNGGDVRRYAPDGTLDRQIPMPVGLPTSVTFGGRDLDVMFVTSMGDAKLEGDVAAPGRLGGCVLAVRGLGVRGVPEVRFAG